MKNFDYRTRAIIFLDKSSDAAIGWAGWALAHPDLGFQLTLFQPGEVDYAHHITACPPGFENLTASLVQSLCYFLSF